MTKSTRQQDETHTPPAPEQGLKARFTRAATRWKTQASGAAVTVDMLNDIRMRKRFTEEPFGGEIFVAKRTQKDTWNFYISTLTENGGPFRQERLLAGDLSLKEVLNRFAAAPGEGMTYNPKKYNHPAAVMKM
ncbi:MAG: hypothetical protein PW788_07550 [Micavibrio sp.]|nr:hypothetical protein [Micavibrio sp.]